MTYELENPKHSGKFTIAPDKKVTGELTIAGRNSSLYVWDDNLIDVREIFSSITGTLHDLKKVSLINCVKLSRPGLRMGMKGGNSYIHIFPHYVLIGNHHFLPDKETICEVNFVIDDVTALFYDLNAFGYIDTLDGEMVVRPLIEQIIQSIRAQRKSMGIDLKIESGKYPCIAYYTGKRAIFSVDTELGRISALHNADTPNQLGAPGGVEIKNTISVNLRFSTKIHFEEAMHRTFKILKFLGLLIGRPQNLMKLTILKESDQEKSTILQVYGSMIPKYERLNKRQEPHHRGVLLDVARYSKEFTCILSNWLERDKTWYDARSRFFDYFEKQRKYDVDRLIGAVNMFDILPEDAVPNKIKLSAGLKCARDQCKSIFKKLKEKTSERARLLDALGRIGQSSLREKIIYRSRLLIEQIGDQIPDIDKVIKEAVECRNHYVHGSESRIDYSKNRETEFFLTDTLEFVFAASDLIEAGWDIKKWYQNRAGPPHPFAEYLNNYKEQLEKLKSLLS